MVDILYKMRDDTYKSGLHDLINYIKQYGDTKKMKMMSLDQLKDKHLGEVGTIERDKYEFDLKIEILGDMIKSIRKERHLTQEQLGELIGVQKSQISKLEKNTRNVTIETILKVFKALKTNIKFSVEMSEGEFKIA